MAGKFCGREGFRSDGQLAPEVPSDEATIELATRPTRGDWIGYVLSFVMLTAVGAICSADSGGVFCPKNASGTRSAFGSHRLFCVRCPIFVPVCEE